MKDGFYVRPIYNAENDVQDLKKTWKFSVKGSDKLKESPEVGTVPFQTVEDAERIMYSLKLSSSNFYIARVQKEIETVPDRIQAIWDRQMQTVGAAL